MIHCASQGIARYSEQKNLLHSLINELKACTFSSNLRKGKRIHETAVQSGLQSNVLLTNTLIRMYAKCGCLNESRRVFEAMQAPSVASWNALIMGYADNGDCDSVHILFSKMENQGCVPDAKTFVSVLKACSIHAVKSEENRLNVARGKAVHLLALRKGQVDLYVQNTLVDMYAKYGTMEKSRRVFDTISSPDVVSWNALLFGYAENGEGEAALDLFPSISCETDSRTFLATFKACIDLALKGGDNVLQRGKALHLLAICKDFDSDIFVKSILVDMYGKCGCMLDALKLFVTVDNPDVVFWTALISGYAENGDCEMALDLFTKMARKGSVPNERTFVAALKACTDLPFGNGRERGKATHLLMSSNGFESNIKLQNTLVRLYAKCNIMAEARRVFDSIGRPDCVSWNALILGYTEERQGGLALELLLRMRREGWEPNPVTFIAAIKACIDIAAKEDAEGKAGTLERGKAVHLLALRRDQMDPYVKSTLVDMYAKCGSMTDSRSVFEAMEDRTIVAWTALMIGYADQEEWNTVLQLFVRMKDEGCEPDAFAFVAALKACSMLGALQLGKNLHSEICRRGFEKHMVLATSLVDFYAKCASMAEAQTVFDTLGSRDVITWTALMTGYSRRGDTQGVFALFDRMLDGGVNPNGVTLLCVLAACSHSGLVEKGIVYFECMPTKYRVQPDVEHYRCMMDILGRANKLEDAMALVRTMPFTPTSLTWNSILAGCRKWKNIKLGELVFESLMSLEHKASGAYTLMANLYQNP